MTRPDERETGPTQGNPFGSGQRRGPDERGGGVALLVAAAGLLLSVLFFPVGLVLSVTAIVIAARALRRATRAPGALAGLVLGSLGVVLAVMLATVFGVFWQEIRSYRDCMSGANTITSQERCWTELERAIGTRVGVTP